MQSVNSFQKFPGLRALLVGLIMSLGGCSLIANQFTQGVTGKAPEDDDEADTVATQVVATSSSEWTEVTIPCPLTPNGFFGGYFSVTYAKETGQFFIICQGMGFREETERWPIETGNCEKLELQITTPGGTRSERSFESSELTLPNKEIVNFGIEGDASAKIERVTITGWRCARKPGNAS